MVSKLEEGCLPVVKYVLTAVFDSGMEGRQETQSHGEREKLKTCFVTQSTNLCYKYAKKATIVKHIPNGTEQAPPAEIHLELRRPYRKYIGSIHTLQEFDICIPIIA